MTEAEPRSFPTNSVAKEDLLYCRPDLERAIEALADSDIERIANKVGDALQEDYWSALGIVLANYLPTEAKDATAAEQDATDTTARRYRNE